MFTLLCFLGAFEEAFERMKLKYAELVAEARQQGWQAHTTPVEMGVRSFVTLFLSVWLLKKRARVVAEALANNLGLSMN